MSSWHYVYCDYERADGSIIKNVKFAWKDYDPIEMHDIQEYRFPDWYSSADRANAMYKGSVTNRGYMYITGTNTISLIDDWQTSDYKITSYDAIGDEQVLWHKLGYLDSDEVDNNNIFINKYTKKNYIHPDDTDTYPGFVLDTPGTFIFENGARLSSEFLQNGSLRFNLDDDEDVYSIALPPVYNSIWFDNDVVEISPSTGNTINAAYRFESSGYQIYHNSPQNSKLIKDALRQQEIIDDGDPDPYLPDDEDPSLPDGGDGDHDPGDDLIPIPSLPTISVQDSGFVTLFNPSLIQLRTLSDYMWSSYPIDELKKMFANPMDAIIGLQMLPVAIPSARTKEVRVGGISTGVSMSVADDQWVSKSLGAITLKEYFGAYLDYSPYTKVSIYLPYIGDKQLDIDFLETKTIGVVYHIDIYSGACIAFISCNGNVMYQFSGNCGMSVPFNGANYDRAISSIINFGISAGTVAATAATGGAAAIGAASVSGLVSSASNAIMNTKPDITKSNAIGSTTGLLGVQKAYLMVERPRQCVPANQASLEGYPAGLYSKLSGLTGFTVVESIHLESIPCTDAELAEIERLLKEGVIL